jgi:hypothetical protein
MDMTKYATLTKYQPYIDVIMNDLGLTGKVHIDWNFGKWRSYGGSAVLYTVVYPDGLRHGDVQIDNGGEHAWTLTTLMHELKHIQQYYMDRLTPSKCTMKLNKRGTKYIRTWSTVWEGIEQPIYGCSRSAKLNNKYLSQPWEVEAYDYQKEVARLFPNNKLQERKLIGVVGRVKFYKTAA